MQNNRTGTISIGVFLMILFVSLKLTNVIDWSWWTVILIPIGVEVGIVVGFLSIVGIMMLIALAIKVESRRYKW